MMVEIMGNPRAAGLMRDAEQACGVAGVSVQGLLPCWRASQSDPGKATFWVDGLVRSGVAVEVAYRTVVDLERIKRGW